MGLKAVKALVRFPSFFFVTIPFTDLTTFLAAYGIL